MSSVTLDIQDATSNFSRLVDDVAGGDVVVISRAGKPMARLVPINAPATAKKLGLLEGKISVPEDFNAPLSDEPLARR